MADSMLSDMAPSVIMGVVVLVIAGSMADVGSAAGGVMDGEPAAPQRVLANARAAEGLG